MTERMNIRRVSFLGVLVALALALHLLEAQIPSPLPWIRPGLANPAAAAGHPGHAFPAI